MGPPFLLYPRRTKGNASYKTFVENFFKSLVPCFDEQFQVNEGNIGKVFYVFSPMGVAEFCLQFAGGLINAHLVPLHCYPSWEIQSLSLVILVGKPLSASLTPLR